MSEMASASDTRVNSQVHLRTMNVSVNLPEELQTTKNGPVITTIPIDGPDELEAPTLVSFTPNDPRNPQNWSSAFKWYCTIVVAFASFVVTFNSSVVTADLPGVSKEFGVSEQVSLLTVSLLVLGFGIGIVIRLTSFATTN